MSIATFISVLFSVLIVCLELSVGDVLCCAVDPAKMTLRFAWKTLVLLSARWEPNYRFPKAFQREHVGLFEIWCRISTGMILCRPKKKRPKCP